MTRKHWALIIIGSPIARVPWSVPEVLYGILAAIVAVGMVAIGAMALISKDDDLTEFGATQIVFLALLQLCFVLVTMWFTVKRYRVGLRLMGFVAPKGHVPYLSALLVWIAALVVSAVWGLFIRAMGPDVLKPTDIVEQLGGLASVNLLVLLGLVCLWGPLTEEVFFRVFILRGIASNFGVGFAILASSAIFALFHISISKLVPSFILGIALAWIYIRYGSIWPSIMVHSVHNATAVLMAKSAESNLI